MRSILRRISPKRLAKMAWKWGKPKLEKHVEATDNDMDNDALDIISAIVEGYLESK